MGPVNISINIEHPLHKSNIGEGTKIAELNEIHAFPAIVPCLQVQPYTNKITARYWLEAITNNVSVKESICSTSG